MVDYTEITTTFKDENKFYRVGNCAIKFYVKSKGGVAIGLASSPTEDTIHWIVIGNGYSWIIHADKVKTPDILSEHEYRPFWISWYNNRIRLGVGGVATPIVEKTKFKDIKYLTFSTFKRNIVHWRIQLPFELPEPVYKEIDTGKLTWVKMTDGCLPEGALIGGYENEILYIMRAMHEMALTPGKYVPSEGAGFVAWGYHSHRKTGNLEILCGYNGIWAPTEEDEIPFGAPICGYTEYGEDMFVGRAIYNNILMPGKIAPSHKVCYLAYENDSVSNPSYEILVLPNTWIVTRL